MGGELPTGGAVVQVKHRWSAEKKANRGPGMIHSKRAPYCVS